MSVLIVTLFVVLVLAAVFGLLLWKLASRASDEAGTVEWLQAFSVERYGPMERLLDPSDFQFLKEQGGYRAEIGARLLRDRKRLFLDYLGLLAGDFNQLLRIARVMIVYSADDRSDFARALWRERVAFYMAVCAVRVRVALYPLAWNGLDVSRLVHSLESMRRQVIEMGLPPISINESA